MEKQARINHVLGLPRSPGNFAGPFGGSTGTQRCPCPAGDSVPGMSQQPPARPPPQPCRPQGRAERSCGCSGCSSVRCVCPELRSGRWAHGSTSSHPSPGSSAAGGWHRAVPGAPTGSGLSRCPAACTQPVGAARPAQRRWQRSHLPHRRSTEVFPVTLSSRKKGGEAVHSLNPRLALLSRTLGCWPAPVTPVFPPLPSVPTPPTDPAATPRGFPETLPYSEQDLTLQKRFGKLTSFKELCGGVFLSVSHSPPPFELLKKYFP